MARMWNAARRKGPVESPEAPSGRRSRCRASSLILRNVGPAVPAGTGEVPSGALWSSFDASQPGTAGPTSPLAWTDLAMVRHADLTAHREQQAGRAAGPYA